MGFSEIKLLALFKGICPSIWSGIGSSTCPICVVNYVTSKVTLTILS